MRGVGTTESWLSPMNIGLSGGILSCCKGDYQIGSGSGSEGGSALVKRAGAGGKVGAGSSYTTPLSRLLRLEAVVGIGQKGMEVKAAERICRGAAGCFR